MIGWWIRRARRKEQQRNMLVIGALAAYGPQYGGALEATTGLDNGTLYAHLGRLEDAGHITGEWETDWPIGRQRRFIYRLVG